MHALSGNYFLSLLVLALSLAPVVLNLVSTMIITLSTMLMMLSPDPVQVSRARSRRSIPGMHTSGRYRSRVVQNVRCVTAPRSRTFDTILNTHSCRCTYIYEGSSEAVLKHIFSHSAAVTIVSRTSLILADAILVCTTWFKLYRGGGLRKKTFAYVLLYDG